MYRHFKAIKCLFKCCCSIPALLFFLKYFVMLQPSSVPSSYLALHCEYGNGQNRLGGLRSFPGGFSHWSTLSKSLFSTAAVICPHKQQSAGIWRFHCIQTSPSCFCYFLVLCFRERYSLHLL